MLRYFLSSNEANEVLTRLTSSSEFSGLNLGLGLRLPDGFSWLSSGHLDVNAGIAPQFRQQALTSTFLAGLSLILTFEDILFDLLLSSLNKPQTNTWLAVYMFLRHLLLSYSGTY